MAKEDDFNIFSFEDRQKVGQAKRQQAPFASPWFRSRDPETGKLRISRKPFPAIPTVTAAPQVAQKLDTVINPIRSKLGWEFGDPNRVMNRLKAARPGIASSPGFMALQDMVAGLQGKKYTPNLYVSSAESVFPYVQMELGGKIIDIPFETQRGVVSRGMRVRTASQVIAKDKIATFSERIAEVVNRIPTGMGNTKAGSWVGKALYRMSVRYTGSAMHMGEPVIGRLAASADAVTFGKNHPFSQRLSQIAATFASINKMELQGGEVGDAFGRAQRELTDLYYDVERSPHNLTVIGTKWDNMVGDGSRAARMMAFSKNLVRYPGMVAGDPAKGFHHLADRAIIEPILTKRSGFHRSAPWVSPLGGAATRFQEMPMNIGIWHPEFGGKYVGDSGILLHSNRAANVISGHLPYGTKKTLIARLHRADGGGHEIERRLSPWVQEIFDKYGLDEHFRTNNIFHFDNQGLRLARGRRHIGQSISRTAKDPTAGIGKQLYAPKGELLRSITARRRGQTMEYQFLFGEGSGAGLDVSRATLTVGTTRGSVSRFVGVGANANPIDISMRAQDFWKGSLSGSPESAAFANENIQARMASRWLKKSGIPHHQFNIAQKLGLTPQKTRQGEVTFAAGNNWVVTKEQVAKVRKYVDDNKIASLMGDKFFKTNYVLSQREFDTVMNQFNITDAVERERWAAFNKQGKLLQVSEGGGVGFRQAMSGMKSRRGMKVRLDQALSAILQGDEADTLTRIMTESKGGQLLREVGGFYGPAIEGSAAEQFKTITIDQMRQKFGGRVPQLGGGVGVEKLKGTILDPNRQAFWLDLGQEVPVFTGTTKELGEDAAKWASTRRVLIGSPGALGVGGDAGGLAFLSAKRGDPRTPAQALVDLTDVILNPDKTTNARSLGVKVSAYMMAQRAGALGKGGFANAFARAKFSSYSRLQLLPGKSNVLTIGVTEGFVRNMYRGHPDKAKAVLAAMQSNEGFFASVLRWPQKETLQFQRGVKVRLMNAQELSTLRGTRASFDKIIYASADLMALNRGDQDADAITAIFQMEKDVQRRAGKFHAQNKGWMSLLAEEYAAMDTAKWSPHVRFRTVAESQALLRGWSRRVAERTAQLTQMKTASPFPEVFMRARRRAAELMTIGAGNVPTLLGEQQTARQALRTAGLEGLAKMKMTAEQFSAMDVFAGGWSQQATGKVKAAQFALNEALYEVGQTGRTGKLSAALKELAEIPEVATRLEARGFAQSQAVRLGTEAFTMVESGVSVKGFMPTAFGAMYGTSTEKSAQAAVGVTGGKLADVAMTSDSELAALLGAERGIKIQDQMAEEFNRGVKETAGGSHIRGRLFGRFKGGIKNMWASGWGGKAALIAGGAFILKGMADALTPVEDPTPRQAPMPPDIRLQQQQMMPQFSIPTADTRLERPNQASYNAQMSVKGAYFETDGLLDHISRNLLDSRHGSGRVVVQNTPMTETEMEYLLRDKMRSDF